MTMVFSSNKKPLHEGKQQFIITYDVLGEHNVSELRNQLYFYYRKSVVCMRHSAILAILLNVLATVPNLNDALYQQCMAIKVK